MTAYQLIDQWNVQRLADGACIPFASGNTDYQEYKQWLAAGNTPLPAPEPPAPAPEPTAHEKLKRVGLTVEELKALLAS